MKIELRVRCAGSQLNCG